MFVLLLPATSYQLPVVFRSRVTSHKQFIMRMSTPRSSFNATVARAGASEYTGLFL